MVIKKCGNVIYCTSCKTSSKVNKGGILYGIEFIEK